MASVNINCYLSKTWAAAMQHVRAHVSLPSACRIDMLLIPPAVLAETRHSFPRIATNQRNSASAEARSCSLAKC